MCQRQLKTSSMPEIQADLLGYTVPDNIGSNGRKFHTQWWSETGGGYSFGLNLVD